MPEKIFTGGYFQRGILLDKVNVFTSQIFGSGFIGGYSVYGGSGTDEEDSSAITVDDNNVYVVGGTMTPSAGSNYDIFIIKASKSDFTLSSQKRVYSSNGDSFGYDVTHDDTYIYVSGYAPFKLVNGYSPGALIMRLNKSTMTIDAQKYLYDSGEEGSESAVGIYVDGSNVYVSGMNFGTNMYPFVAKLSLDLSTLSLCYGYGSSNDRFYKLDGDTNYLYVVGATSDYKGTVAKLNKSDLTVVAAKTIGSGGTTRTRLYDVCVDDNYVYVVGETNEQGAGNYDILIAKLNKSDLSVVAQKVIGSSDIDSASGISQDTNSIYIVGYTTILSNDQPVIIKLSKSDLSVESQKYVYSTTSDDGYDVYIDSNVAYVVGYGEENNGDVLLIRLNSLMPAGNYMASDTRELRDSGLTLTTSTLSVADWSIAPTAVSPSYGDAGLSIADLSMSMTSYYEWS